MLQGQSGEVTCEAEGPSVSTLRWEKQQDDKSYAAVPNSQVNVTKDTKYVRATLKITNAQFADTGTYKCTVSVPPNLSDYKLTAIKVKGRFVCFCLFVYTLVGVYCPVRKNCLIFIYPCITDLTSIMTKKPWWRISGGRSRGPEGWQNSKSIWDRFRTFWPVKDCFSVKSLFWWVKILKTTDAITWTY